MPQIELSISEAERERIALLITRAELVRREAERATAEIQAELDAVLQPICARQGLPYAGSNIGFEWAPSFRLKRILFLDEGATPLAAA